MREHGLVSIERREALQFNQLGLQFAGRVAHQPKIHLHKEGVGSFARNFELLWNGRGRDFAVIDAVQLLDQFLAVLAHLIEKRLGQEARRLADPKLDRRPAALFQKLEQTLIFFRRVVRVELLSKGRNHDLSTAAVILSGTQSDSLANRHGVVEATPIPGRAVHQG